MHIHAYASTYYIDLLLKPDHTRADKWIRRKKRRHVDPTSTIREAHGISFEHH